MLYTLVNDILPVTHRATTNIIIRVSTTHSDWSNMSHVTQDYMTVPVVMLTH